MTYRTIRIEKEVYDLIDEAEKEYRKHHPEMDMVNLSKSKILYEVLAWYLPRGLVKK